MGEITPKRLGKELKVENWASYFLQRLSHLYANSTHCDFTLRFSNSATMKVHRLVLLACTDYFDTLSIGNSVTLDGSMTPEVISLIIGFMYTGKIEIKADILDKLYEVSAKLRLPILTRLIESHRSQEPDVAQQPGAVAFDKSAAVPAAGLPLGQVLKPVSRNDVPLPKRLSIWKRKVPPSSIIPMALPSAECMIRVGLSKPVPTRMEWNEPYGDDFPMCVVGDALIYMSHDNNLICKQPIPLEASEPEYETYDNVSITSSVTSSPLKRKRNEGSDLHNMKEFGRQQQIRNEIMMEEEDVDEPGVADEPSSPLTPPKPILKQISRTDSTESPKRVRFSVAQNELRSLSPVRKSIVLESKKDSSLSAQVTIPAAPVLSDVSRGAASGEVIVTQHPFPGQPTESLKRVRYSVLSSDGSETSVTEQLPGSPSVDNPAKIVSEVLKKYPNLVSGYRKNIKLKVMTNNLGLPATDGSAKNVSYIVVKGAESLSDVSMQPCTAPDWDPCSPAPWSCKPCQLNFATYVANRKHFVEVHHVLVDPRICEFCGLKVSKKNFLMYHQVVHHGVEPPLPNTFPKCEQCRHIALSQAMLIKHQETYHNKYRCTTCNIQFKSSLLLTNHMETCSSAPPVPDRQYRCPYCEQIFKERNVLQEHILSQHWGPSEKKEVEESQIQQETTTEDRSSLEDQYTMVVDDEGSQPSMDSFSSQSIVDPAQPSVESNIGDGEKKSGYVVVVDNNPVNESDSSFIQTVEDDAYNGDQTQKIDERLAYEDVVDGGEERTIYEVKSYEMEATTENEPVADQTIVFKVNNEKNVQNDECIDNSQEETEMTISTNEVSGTSLTSEPEPPEIALQCDTQEISYDVENETDSSSQPALQVQYEVQDQTDHSQSNLVYAAEEEQTEPRLEYHDEATEQHSEQSHCLVYEPHADQSESYKDPSQVPQEEMEFHVEGATDPSDSLQQNLVYETHPIEEKEQTYENENVDSQSEGPYEVIDSEVPTSEDMVIDADEPQTEEELEEQVQEEVEGSQDRGGQGDHDYAPYNSVVMFQPNMVIPQRVMLVTHPIAHPLQVLLSGPNMMQEQLVSIPYPQCNAMQVVGGGQVVTTSSGSTDCSQVVRERKVEPETLANDWDESSQAEEVAAPVVLPGSGPSRPEFF